MKTSFKTIIAVFALVSSFTFASAKNTGPEKASSFGTGIYINKEGKINVLVDKNDTNSKTTILIKNNEGEIVYRETVEKENQKFGRLLNVDNLEAGQYEINVVSKNETQSKSFQLSEQKTERNITIK